MQEPSLRLKSSFPWTITFVPHCSIEVLIPATEHLDIILCTELHNKSGSPVPIRILSPFLIRILIASRKRIGKVIIRSEKEKGFSIGQTTRPHGIENRNTKLGWDTDSQLTISRMGNSRLMKPIPYSIVTRWSSTATVNL